MVDFHNKAWQVAKYAVMLALIFVATVLDRTLTAYMPITGATIEMLMTLSLCFLFNSWLDGLLAGTLMGLSSFATAFMFGKLVPQNPLVSVLPRVFVGLAAFCVYKLMLLLLRKVKNKALRQTIAIVPASFVGLICNTVLFLGATVLFKNAYGSLVEAIATLEIASMLPEYLVSLFGVAPLTLGVRRGLKLGIDGNNWKHINDVCETEKEQTSEIADVIAENEDKRDGVPSSEHETSADNDDIKE
ncbi:MAG: hypothetical protein NC099_04245 [Corallococcus sp.]|nr:hypothetical protein [Corallococcus sp.]